MAQKAKSITLYYDIPEWDISEVYEVKTIEEAYEKLAKELAKEIDLDSVICLESVPEFHLLLSIRDVCELLNLSATSVLFITEHEEAFYALVLHEGQFFGLQVGEWSKEEQEQDIDEPVEKLKEVLS